MSKIEAPLRILIYAESFLPSVGGVQTLVNLLANGLTAREATPPIQVTVATRTPANAIMDDSALPYRVVRQPGLGRLASLIREADFIHVAGPCFLPMAIAWLIRKPFVVEHHGYQAVCPNGLLFEEPVRTICPGYFAQGRYGKCLRCESSRIGSPGAMRSLLLMFPRRWLSKRAGANITVTNHVAARVALPRSRTIYHGIEPSAPLETHSPESGRPACIAYVGRLVPEKGPSVLLAAAKLLKDRGVTFNLKFIGEGPERQKLEDLSEQLGLSASVCFKGDLRGPELDRAVSDIEIVVMPSMMEETAGLSAIEQMMRGRVVIAANVGGLAEVVGEAGLKFTPGNAEDLANCIRRVVESPALAKSLGDAARERALRLFTRDAMIEAHVSLYREALDR